MGKPKLFVINLSGDNSVYFSGSSVEGSVLLELSEPKKAQGISIMLSGKAYVHWRHTVLNSNKNGSLYEQTISCSDTQVIFNDVFIQLWGNGTDSQELAAGRYEFPFQFLLPSDMTLPTSYEGENGYIRYSLLSRIKRSWRFDHTTTRGITVNEHVDVNQLIMPVSRSKELIPDCCCPFASGSITLSITTDRAGYCPGESIGISAVIENHSSKRVSFIEAYLRKVVVYRAMGYSSREGKIFPRVKGPGVEPGVTADWRIQLPIPATVPSIKSCRVLEVKYELYVVLCIRHVNGVNLRVPITIGNIPFKGRGHPQIESYQPIESFPASGLLSATNSNLPLDCGFAYSTIDPPVDIGFDRYTMGERQYAPVYIFVTNYQVPPAQTDTETIDN